MTDTHVHDFALYPPLWVVEDGAAKAIPHTKTVYEDAKKAGITLYSTLAGAIIYGGVQAHAFRHPVKSVPVYNGEDALRLGSVTTLTPVGMRAEYRIVATPDGLVHPPKHPSDL